VSLRNYRAFTMSEALAAVREDLGADAVIMHTRTFTQGGFLGLGKKTVVEVTASPSRDLVPSDPRNRTEVKRQATPLPTFGGAGEGSAARAVSAYRNAAPSAESTAVKAFGSLQLDRERTRLLAQAMALTMEREEQRVPRSSATASASANAAATSRAPASSAVAQRYLLMPADRPKTRPVAATIAPPDRVPPAPPAQPVQPVQRAESVSATTATPRAVRDDPPDLDAIDRLVSEVLRRNTSAGAPAPMPARLAELYSTLIAQEVGRDIADRIVNEIRTSLSPEELASDHAVRSAAIARIALLLPATGELAPMTGGAAGGGWRRNGRPLTVVFVGPTGVGKTTTVAKIAATLKLRHGARVGLVTCDTYRIAAVEQLRTYAEIIGVPLEVVLSPGQMRQSAQKLRDLDVILVDTAGRSQNDADRLGELKAVVAAAEPHETHLVLSSVASEKALLREARAFSAIGIDKVVLTKLDEAAGLGAVLRVLRDVGRSVSYITTGQEVPQHIESAQPARLAELVLAGALTQPGISNQTLAGASAT